MGVIKTLNKLHKMKKNKRESKKHLIEPQGTIFGFIAFVYWEKATLSESQMISSILNFILCITIMFRQRVHSFPFPFQKKRRRKKKNRGSGSYPLTLSLLYSFSNNFVARIICNLTKSPLSDFYNLNHLNRQSADCINIFFIIRTSHLLYDSVFSTLEDPINL